MQLLKLQLNIGSDPLPFKIGQQQNHNIHSSSGAIMTESCQPRVNRDHKHLLWRSPNAVVITTSSLLVVDCANSNLFALVINQMQYMQQLLHAIINHPEKRVAMSSWWSIPWCHTKTCPGQKQQQLAHFDALLPEMRGYSKEWQHLLTQNVTRFPFKLLMKNKRENLAHSHSIIQNWNEKKQKGQWYSDFRSLPSTLEKGCDRYNKFTGPQLGNCWNCN